MPPIASRYWYLTILALCAFVTSFGAHSFATNLPSYAEIVGAGVFMIGLLMRYTISPNSSPNQWLALSPTGAA
jgi:hypothetical protein